MRWTTKAAIQNTLAAFPGPIANSLYYWLQRYAGGLRRVSPVNRLQAGVETWTHIQKAGQDPKNKVFFEVGTGWIPLVPLAYWLMGAERIITVDSNAYLRSELVKDSLLYCTNHEAAIQQLFGQNLITERWQALLDWYKSERFSLAEFFERCGITYIAPGDAADTKLPDQRVDFHTSYTVFEHLPPDILQAVINEGNRIVKESGLFVHCIDYSDHFSHADPGITAVNFLQYPQREWQRVAGNRFMYMNRMRHDDYTRLLRLSGHRILSEVTQSDSRALEALRQGRLTLAPQFADKSFEVLAVRNAWIVSQFDSRKTQTGEEP